MKRKTIYFLFYDQCIVNGGFFDNFEYYYLIKQCFPECTVKYRVITDHPRTDVIKILDDKYENIEDKVLKDIEVMPHVPGKFYQDPLIIDLLFCATNSAIYWFLKHNNIQVAKSYIGLADYRMINPSQDKFYKKCLTLYDERIFNYDGITSGKPYRKKILFDKFKHKSYASKYDYMLNMSLVERRFDKDFIMGLFDKYNGSFAVYTGHKNEEYYSWLKNIPDIHLIIPPVEDFMGLFKTFVYLPYTSGFDATPRLIPECVFYNKQIEYHGYTNNLNSGGYYRYKDTMENFDSLWLRHQDEVIEEIKKCLL